MKKMRLGQATFLYITALLLLVFCSPAQADSLWNDQGDPLYGVKPKTFKVGDLLTIIIAEQATASQQATSSNGKTGNISGQAGTGLLNAIPPMGAGWDSSYKGTGSTTRGGSLSAKITVEVKEVNPNGTLLLEGHQVIKVNGEEQVLKVSGIARAEDIATDNTIQSYNISSAVIEYQGSGTIGETQKPGLITKFFHWLF